MFLLIVSLIGCGGGGDSNPAGPSEPIDESLLIGKWQEQGSLNVEQYNADHTFIWWFGGENVRNPLKGTWKIQDNYLGRHFEIGSCCEWREIISISQTEMRLKANQGASRGFVEVVFTRI